MRQRTVWERGRSSWFYKIKREVSEHSRLISLISDITIILCKKSHVNKLKDWKTERLGKTVREIKKVETAFDLAENKDIKGNVRLFCHGVPVKWKHKWDCWDFLITTSVVFGNAIRQKCIMILPPFRVILIPQRFQNIEKRQTKKDENITKQNEILQIWPKVDRKKSNSCFLPLISG